MLGYIESLGIPGGIAIGLVIFFFIVQGVGEILKTKGMLVPEVVSLKSSISKRKKEKEEVTQTLKEVQKLLGDVNQHYSDDNIAKRNSWMKWVDERTEAYDSSIVDITKSLEDVMAALNANTKLTEEMFVQSSRDRVIDFSYKAPDYSLPVSREEYHRIFNVYDKYEKFLAEHGMTNGEIDIVYGIIKASYEERSKNHAFAEDIHGCV